MLHRLLLQFFMCLYSVCVCVCVCERVSVTQTAAPVLHVFVQCVCCNCVCVCVCVCVSECYTDCCSSSSCVYGVCVCVLLMQVLCRRLRQVSQSSVVQRFVAVRGFSAAGSSGSDEPYIAVPSQNSGVKCVL